MNDSFINAKILKINYLIQALKQVRDVKKNPEILKQRYKPMNFGF